jgi:hypothetical protein
VSVGRAAGVLAYSNDAVFRAVGRSDSVVCMRTEPMVGRREVAGAGDLLALPPPYFWPLLCTWGKARPQAPATELVLPSVLLGKSFI